MDNYDNILDEYEKKLGLPGYKKLNENDVEKYFTLTRNQLEKLTTEQCAIAAVELQQLAFHVQRAYNREIAKKNYVFNDLKKYVAGQADNHTGSWARQEIKVISGDEHASKLDKIISHAQLRIDRLNFMANAIRCLAESIINIQKVKYGQKSS